MSVALTRTVAEGLRDALAQGLRTRILVMIVTLTMGGTLCSHAFRLDQRRDVEALASSLVGRTIRLSAEDDASVAGDGTVDALARLAQVEQVIALGPVTDYSNELVPGAPPAAVRDAAVLKTVLPGLDAARIAPGSAVAPPQAARGAGLADGLGTLVSPAGELSVRGGSALDERFADFQKTILRPTTRRADGWSVVIITVSSPRDVNGVATIASQLLRLSSDRPLRVQTGSDVVAALDQLAGSQRRQARPTLFATSGIAALLVGGTAWSSVSSRRRDYGRRRALGATRSTVVVLVMGGYGLLTLAGVSTGCILGVLCAKVARWPIPSLQFVAGVGLLQIEIGIAALVGPAIVCARRDPVRELRVP